MIEIAVMVNMMAGVKAHVEKGASLACRIGGYIKMAYINGRTTARILGFVSF